MRLRLLAVVAVSAALLGACGDQENTQKAEDAVAGITGGAKAPARGANAELLLTQAQQAANQGRDADARAAFDRAVQVFQANGDHGGVGRVLLALATHTRTTGQGEVARGIYARARAAFEQVDDRTGVARVIFAVAELERARFNNDAALTGFEEAAGIFRAHQLWREEAQALLGVADSDRRLGRVTSADAVLARAHAIFEILEDREGMQASERARTELVNYVDDNDRERLRLAENINYADQGGNRLLEALGHLGLGQLEALAGRPTQARRALSEARLVFATMKLPHGEFDAWAVTGDLERRLGNASAAVDAYTRALVAFARAQDVQSHEATKYEEGAAIPLPQRGAIVMARLSQFDPEEAAAVRLAGAREMASDASAAAKGAVLVAEGWLARRRGAGAEAAASFDAATRTFVAAGLHGAAGESLLAQAALVAQSNALLEAANLYEQALGEFATARDRLGEAEAQFGSAGALAAIGDSPMEAQIRYRIAARLYAESEQRGRAEGAAAAARTLRAAEPGRANR